MTIDSKEHYEIMEHFERHLYKGIQLAREEKRLWPKGNIYCNGDVNRQFLAYRQGYALAKSIFQN